jgi:DNA-binding ferritin-like protein
MSQHQRDKRAYLNATPMQREVVRRLLCDVLGCLRASYLSYQTSHWQVIGGSFYGNHLLFARLYESVQAQVDGLAEKLVGYLGREVVSLDHQIKHIAAYTMRWSQIDCHHKRGLQSEADLQAALKRAYDGIKQINAMTLGLDDWIMATANAHEENEYLLQQALTPVPGQKQASSAEDFFYDNPEKKEVLEFADTGAISNSPEVAAAASREDMLDIPEAEAVAEAGDSPPTPVEIKDGVGGAALSTLNRLVVESEDPDAAKAAEVNRTRMAAWLKELDRE